MERVRQFLLKVAHAPPGQLNPEVCARIRAMCEAGVSAPKLQAIMDDCARYSLASDFAMVAMDAALSELRKGPDAENPPSNLRNT